MRVGLGSVFVIAVVSGGLTLNGLDALCTPRDGCVKKLAHHTELWLTDARAHVLDVVGPQIEERKPGPTYALAVAGGVIAGLDRDGLVTCLDTAFAGRSLPSLTGFAFKCAPCGSRVSSPPITIGLSVIRAFEQHRDLFNMLSEVNVASLDNPRVILRGRVVVDLGRGDYCTKVERLYQVLVHAPHLGMCPTRVDLRFDRQAVVEYSEVKHQGRKEA